MNFTSLKRLLFLALIICTFHLFTSCRAIRFSRKYGTNKEFHLMHQGINRSYLVHFPDQNNLQTCPVLFCLHGGGGTANGMIRLTYGRFNELSDKEGFIVVYPQGVDKGWNDGRKGDFSTAITDEIDDTGFFIRMIEALKSSHNIDTSKIFTCGISNGGFMSARLACDLSTLIRGAAIITATLGVDYLPLCKPSKPVRILIMNGTADPLVPYEGGDIKILRKTRGKIISTDEFVHLWTDRNVCNAVPIKEFFPNIDPGDGTRVELSRYSACAEGSEVLFYKIINGGHTWPGGKQYLNEKYIGKTSRDINACDEIWDFFKK
jgi:polyhydroxybutyrate depolymerase